MHDNPRMVSRFAAFVIWAAVAASIVFWAMRLGAQPIAVPAHVTVVAASNAYKGDLARVLGADEPPPAVASAAAPPPADPRFKLIGVVAPRGPGAQAAALALIATDGKPARAYRVGTQVDGDLVLLAVHARGAALGPPGQPAQVALELPALPPPATGTMPGPAGIGAAPRLPPLPQPQVPRPAPMPLPQVQPPLPQAPPSQDATPPDAASEPESDAPADRPVFRPPTLPGRSPT